MLKTNTMLRSRFWVNYQISETSSFINDNAASLGDRLSIISLKITSLSLSAESVFSEM